MKKFLVLFILLFGLTAQADVMEVEQISDMPHFWEQNGRPEQKVLEVGAKIINANKLDKRIPINLDRNSKIINAFSSMPRKTVTIYYGILPYFDNDDELAYVLSHEMAHSLDAYGGPFKWIKMVYNSKEYEFKADLIGIDLMVKAGYNPIAAICTANKWMGESYWDFWIFTTHPKTSRRLLKMYEYIYVKYPWALKTDMVKNLNYQNFLYSSQKEVNAFLQHQKERSSKQKTEDI
ncbi:MAG: M48 family metalloprotease [Candidatus Gastranaerophilales bacterium]|nr:M48 family metalloprotease [Candidatus Gastranaerophilales bacterium]